MQNQAILPLYDTLKSTDQWFNDCVAEESDAAWSQRQGMAKMEKAAIDLLGNEEAGCLEDIAVKARAFILLMFRLEGISNDVEWLGATLMNDIDRLVPEMAARFAMIESSEARCG